MKTLLASFLLTAAALANAQFPAATLEHIVAGVKAAQTFELDPHDVFGDKGGTLIESVGRATEFPAVVSATWNKTDGLDYGGGAAVMFVVATWHATEWMDIDAGPTVTLMLGEKRTDIMGQLGLSTRFPNAERINIWWQDFPLSKWPIIGRADVSTAKLFLGAGSTRELNTFGVSAGLSIRFQ